MRIFLSLSGLDLDENKGGSQKVVSIFNSYLLKSNCDYDYYLATANRLVQLPIVKLNNTVSGDLSTKGFKKFVRASIKVLHKHPPLHLLFALCYHVSMQFFSSVMFRLRYKDLNKQSVIHSHLTMGTLISFAFGNKMPIIVTYHSKGSMTSDGVESRFHNSFVSKIIKLIEYYEFMKAKLVTFPSSGARHYFFKDLNLHDSYLYKTRIVYNAVNIREIQSKVFDILDTSAKSKIKIITVSSHIIQKRVHDILQIIHEVNYDNLELVIIGDGPLFDQNVLLAKKLHLDAQTSFLKNLENKKVIEELQSADIFIMTSEKVVFDIVTLEAMACGLPVVVSKNGGNLEIITDGVNGFLCEVGNIGEFKDRLVLLINSQELRINIGSSARKLIEEKYNVDHMIGEYEKLYQELFSTPNILNI